MAEILPIPTPIAWPPTRIKNQFGIATLSLGHWRHHKLETRLRAAAKANYQCIDLFDDDWAAYLEDHGLDGDLLWEPTEANLRVARKLGDLVKSLGMQIYCTQPLRNIDGIKDSAERRASLKLVAKRFPFMRAFDTDLVFMCASMRRDSGVTSDVQTVAKDLAELGDMAAAFSHADGGRMLKIGYENLSWAVRKTWPSGWEVVSMANRPNVGIVIDAFNVLAVEWANPYHPDLHGRIFSTLEESLRYLCLSLTSLVRTVPADKIFMFQIGDAELIDPRTFPKPTDPNIPSLLPWSRGHRRYPLETSLGAYMPAELVAAAILATGYEGPLSLEVFADSLMVEGESVPADHAERGIVGLNKVKEAMFRIPAFWDPAQRVTVEDLVRLYRSNREESSG